MVRYADKYDPDLAAAFEKLEEVLPRPLAEHVERTLDVLAQHPRDDAFSERVHRLTRAWAERRVVTLEYEPAHTRPRRPPGSAVVRPYLIEPSLQTHALYLIGWDEMRDGDADIQDRAHPRCRVTPADLRAARGRIDRERRCAGPGTSSPTSRPPTSCCGSPRGRGPRARDDLASDPADRAAADGSLTWRATVAGTIEIRLWILSWGDTVEVVEPADLRNDVARTHRQAASCTGPEPPRLDGCGEVGLG